MTTIARPETIAQVERPRQPQPRITPRQLTVWLGLLPFIVFVVAFQLFPTFSIVTRTFLNNANQFTLENVSALNDIVVRQSFSNTLRFSLISALTGVLFGFMLAWSITNGGLPGWIRNAVLSFCGVAANFAGVPLVFAFIAAYGSTGSVLGRQAPLTQWLNSVGVSLYPSFGLGNVNGLIAVYLFFQIPLMALIMVPALDGLRKEWREASANLGATRWQYWRYVAFPILLPSLLSTFALLYANAFGTHATAYSLIGAGAGQNLVVTILVDSQFRTDTLSNPGLGNALAFLMLIIMSTVIALNTYFRRRAERWLR